MIPRRIKLRGFLSYKDEQEVHFEGSSLWMLSGQNGSGKSSIFDAITFALFANHRGGPAQVQELLNRDSTSLSVEFEFTLDQERYLITRTLKRTQQGRTSSTQQIARCVPEGLNQHRWEPVPDTNRKADCDQWIRNKIGLDYLAFTSSVLLLQGRAERLLDASPKERALLLGQIVDLQRFQELHERANARRQETRDQVKALNAQLGGLPEILPGQLETMRQRIQDVECERSTLQGQLEQWQAAEFDARNWEGWTAEREALLQQQRQVQSLDADRERIEAEHLECQQLTRVVPHLRQIQQSRSALESARHDRGRLQAQADQLRARLETLTHELQLKTAERHKLEERREAAAAEHRQVNQRWNELSGVMAVVAQYENDLAALERVRAELQKLGENPQRELQELKSQLEQMLDSERALPGLRRLHELRQQLQQATERLPRLQGEVQEIRAQGVRIREQRDQWKLDLDAAKERQREAEQRLTSTATLLEQAREAISLFRKLQGAGECQYCGSPLTPQHRAKELARRTTAVQDLEARLHQQQAQFAAHQQQAQELQRQHDDADRERERKREAYSAKSREVEAAQRSIHDLEDQLGHLYDSLPERFRVLVSPQRPTQWGVLPYPTREELHDLGNRCAESPLLRHRLDQASARATEFTRLQAREELLASQVQQHRQNLPNKEVSLLREEAEQVRARLASLDTTLKTLDGTSKKTAQELERKLQDKQRLDAEANSLSTGMRVEETRIEATQQAIEDRQKLLPREWVERSMTLGVADVHQLNTRQQDLERSGVLARHEQLHQSRSVLARLAEELQALQTRIEALPAAARKPAAEVRQQVEQVKHQLREADARHRTAEQELAILQRHAQQREELRAELLTQEGELNRSTILTELLGRDRLQRHLVRLAEVQIVEYANAVLDRLSGGQMSLRLAGSEDCSESALQLEAVNRTTADRPISVAFLSGSQRFRVAVSLALGIGQFASRSHRPIESVIIDEGFGCLDREGRQGMIQELQALRSSLNCVLLVSHQEEFADAFSDGYRFELQNGATQVRRLNR